MCTLLSGHLWGGQYTCRWKSTNLWANAGIGACTSLFHVLHLYLAVDLAVTDMKRRTSGLHKCLINEYCEIAFGRLFPSFVTVLCGNH